MFNTRSQPMASGLPRQKSCTVWFAEHAKHCAVIAAQQTRGAQPMTCGLPRQKSCTVWPAEHAKHCVVKSSQQNRGGSVLVVSAVVETFEIQSGPPLGPKQSLS